MKYISVKGPTRLGEVQCKCIDILSLSPAGPCPAMALLTALVGSTLPSTRCGDTSPHQRGIVGVKDASPHPNPALGETRGFERGAVASQNSAVACRGPYTRQSMAGALSSGGDAAVSVAGQCGESLVPILGSPNSGPGAPKVWASVRVTMVPETKPPPLSFNAIGPSSSPSCPGAWCEGAGGPPGRVVGFVHQTFGE